jgi:hypothetical protein
MNGSGNAYGILVAESETCSSQYIGKRSGTNQCIVLVISTTSVVLVSKQAVSTFREETKQSPLFRRKLLKYISIESKNFLILRRRILHLSVNKVKSSTTTRQVGPVDFLFF